MNKAHDNVIANDRRPCIVASADGKCYEYITAHHIPKPK